MSQPITFQGRSFFFNSLFVFVNLLGLTFVVIGFHKNFENYILLFSLIGFGLITISSALLIIFRGRLMMAGVSRVLVGGLCIVSGLVKANDPIGFSYKLKEYFEDGALAYRIKEWFGVPGFSLEFLIDFALILSITICIVEIVLGVFLIIGGKIKTVIYFTLFMMLFFTFLTWHTANCDPNKKFVDRDTYAMSDRMAMLKIEEAKTNKAVTIFSKTSDFLIVDEKKSPQCVDDCGCFGDAMKGSVGRSLTPSESLWKDLILVYLVIWIFISQWIIEPNNRKQNLIFSIFSIVLISFFSWVFGWAFPILFGIMVLLGALWILRTGGKILGNYGGSLIIVTLISAFFIVYVLMYEPLKDYRPYSVGSNLIKNMNDGVEGKYESLLVYKNKKTGKKIEYSSTSEEYTKSKIWEKKDWVYASMVQKTIVETKLPSISDFEPFISVSDVGKDELKMEFIQNSMADLSITEINVKDFILKSKTIMVVSSSSLKAANFDQVEKLKSIQKGCKEDNIPFIIICTASRNEINDFREKYNFHVPVFVNDEKILQAVSRSNPSLFVIEKAIVKGKYPHRSIPKYETLKSTILQKK